MARPHPLQCSLSDNNQHLNCSGGDRQRGHPSQETLVEMIGPRVSRVSFFMNKFRKKGFIDYNGKIEVHRAIDAVLRDGFASFVIAG
jgi:hypothetical protein